MASRDQSRQRKHLSEISEGNNSPVCAKKAGRTAQQNTNALPSSLTNSQKIPVEAVKSKDSKYLPPHRARAQHQNSRESSSDKLPDALLSIKADSEPNSLLPTAAIPDVTKLEGRKTKPRNLKYTFEELLTIAKTVITPSSRKHDPTLLKMAAIRRFMQSHFPDLSSNRPRKPLPSIAPANTAHKTAYEKASIPTKHATALPKDSVEQSKIESQQSQSQSQLPPHSSGPAFLLPMVITPEQLQEHGIAMPVMVSGSLPSSHGMPAAASLAHPSQFSISTMPRATVQQFRGQVTPRAEDGFWKATNPVYEEPPPSSPRQNRIAGQQWPCQTQAAEGCATCRRFF